MQLQLDWNILYARKFKRLIAIMTKNVWNIFYAQEHPRCTTQLDRLCQRFMSDETTQRNHRLTTQFLKSEQCSHWTKIGLSKFLKNFKSHSIFISWGGFWYFNTFSFWDSHFHFTSSLPSFNISFWILKNLEFLRSQAGYRWKYR